MFCSLFLFLLIIDKYLTKYIYYKLFSMCMGVHNMWYSFLGESKDKYVYTPYFKGQKRSLFMVVIIAKNITNECNYCKKRFLLKCCSGAKCITKISEQHYKGKNERFLRLHFQWKFQTASTKYSFINCMALYLLI